MKILKPFLCASAGAFLSLTMISGSVSADVVEVFGDNVTDLSGFTTIKDDGGAGDAVVSVTGGAGSEKLSLLENSGTDKPEAYVDFAGGNNVLDGFRLDFDVQFNNGAFASVVSDPEILVRFGNAGVLPDSNADTGFQLNFRHESDDSSNQFRATNDGTSSTSSGLGTSTGFNNVAELTEFSFTVLANNANVDQDYVAFGGGSGTVASNTYDLFINGNFIQNYTLKTTDTSGFTVADGFGSFGIAGGSNSDLGTEVLFDNVTIGFGADNGFTAVPEPGSAVLLLSGLFSLGLIRRRS